MSTSWLNSLAVPRKKMAKAEVKQTFFDEPQPKVHIEEAQENDDFVVIDLIGEKDGGSSEVSRESGYEDFVELSIEDAPSEVHTYL